MVPDFGLLQAIWFTSGHRTDSIKGKKLIDREKADVHPQAPTVIES